MRQASTHGNAKGGNGVPKLQHRAVAPGRISSGDVRPGSLRRVESGNGIPASAQRSGHQPDRRQIEDGATSQIPASIYCMDGLSALVGAAGEAIGVIKTE